MNFKQIAERCGLSEKEYKDYFGAMEEYLAAATDGGEFSFTDLQCEAFNNDKFWSSGDLQQEHMIIQGATSSGKTLVSEVAIVDCLKRNKNAIVLIPLKAMVRERRNRLHNDFPFINRIYASSSDYQDNDANIIEGNFDIAVIVYEKFFGMLSQKSVSILDRCQR